MLDWLRIWGNYRIAIIPKYTDSASIAETSERKYLRGIALLHEVLL